MRLSISQSSTCVRFWLNIHVTSVWMTFAVILITTTGDEVRKFLLAAQALGFTNGDYVFITVDLYRTAELGAFDWRYGKMYLRHDDVEMETPGGNAWRITILCLLRRESTGHGRITLTKGPLQWHHNERDCVSNHRRLDCWLGRLFTRTSKNTSKLCVTGLCVGNSPVTSEFPAQRASNAKNVSIWWRHHISDAVFVRIINQRNHLLKLEILKLLRGRWLRLYLSYPVWQPRVQPATTACFIGSEKCCSTKKRKIKLFSLLDFTFITPLYAYVFPYSTWVHIQLRWFNAKET